MLFVQSSGQSSESDSLLRFTPYAEQIQDELGFQIEKKVIKTSRWIKGLIAKKIK